MYVCVCVCLCFKNNMGPNGHNQKFTFCAVLNIVNQYFYLP